MKGAVSLTSSACNSMCMRLARSHDLHHSQRLGRAGRDAERAESMISRPGSAEGTQAYQVILAQLQMVLVRA